MFWASLDHKWWAKFHLGILRPSINFENCCAHLAANFLYFPNIPNFLYLDDFEETYGQKTKNIGNQKNANLSKS